MKLFSKRASSSTASSLTDGELRTLLIQDRDRGWRAFIDQFTPRLLALIERSGIRDRDEAMELYVLICEKLAADDCERLRRHDPAKGELGAWLSVLVKHVMVDWVRSRAGRRRLFGSIKALSPFDQRVFELFYWDHRSAAEIVGLLGPTFVDKSLGDVLESLERVQKALTERQRADLLAMTARSSTPVSLDAPINDDEQTFDTPDPNANPELDAATRERDARLSQALGQLPPEEAAIVRLKYEEGFTLKQIRDALHLDSLSEQRVRDILDRLKARLTAGARAGVSARPALEGGSS